MSNMPEQLTFNNDFLKKLESLRRIYFIDIDITRKYLPTKIEFNNLSHKITESRNDTNVGRASR